MIPSAIILISILFEIVFSLSNYSTSFPIYPEHKIILGCVCIIFSFIISYLQPCKSLIMNMSLSFHTTLLGLLGILLSIWEQNFLVSTEAVAVAFAILPFIPHTMIMMWAVYNIMSQIGSQFFCNRPIFKRISFVLKQF